MPDSLAGVYELGEHLLAPALSIKTITGSGLNLADTGPSLIQPAGEYWRVLAMGASITPGAAGQIIGVSFFMQNPPLASNVYQVLGDQNGVAPRAVLAGESRIDFHTFLPVPIITVPGTVFQSTLTCNVGAGNVALRLSVLIHLLPTS